MVQNPFTGHSFVNFFAFWNWQNKSATVLHLNYESIVANLHENNNVGLCFHGPLQLVEFKSKSSMDKEANDEIAYPFANFRPSHCFSKNKNGNRNIK